MGTNMKANDVQFSIICEHELKSGTFMLYCPAASIPPFFGSEKECKKAQIIFEEKLRREFDKLDENLKKEIINKLDLFFKGKK